MTDLARLRYLYRFRRVYHGLLDPKAQDEILDALPALLNVAEAAKRYRQIQGQPTTTQEVLWACGHALDDALRELT